MGLEEQIRNGKVEDVPMGGPTMDDFSDLMKLLEFKVEENEKPRKWVFITGYAGYWTYKLNVAFQTFGKSKLPRKLKKRMFGTKKQRQEFLPEYYGKG